MHDTYRLTETILDTNFYRILRSTWLMGSPHITIWKSGTGLSGLSAWGLVKVFGARPTTEKPSGKSVQNKHGQF